MVENLLKVILVLKGLQQAGHLRMLNVFRLQSTKIGNWRCDSWKLIWGFQNLRVLCLRFPRFWQRATVANDLNQTPTNEPYFLKKVITGDKWWTYGYDPKVKAQSSQWMLPGFAHQKQVWQSCSKIKTILTVCFDWEGDVPHSTPLQAKQFIRSTSSIFLVGWEMQHDESSRSYGQLVIGSFITSIRPHMHHVLCRVFWQNIKSPRWLKPPIAQIRCSVTSSFSQN